MARINTNVSSLMAQRNLTGAHASLNQALQRLSSGLKINRGADDPAGLIASEMLRSEIAGISQAIDNSERAASVIATAEGALDEVASLLLNIKELTVEAANKGAISPEEIRANQLQIDSAVQSITRISNTTNFAGLNLLDGSLDYNLSGVDGTEVDNVRIFNAQFASATSIPVNVSVLTSAQPAELRWPTSALNSAVTLEVAGVYGVETIQFAASTTVDTIYSAINQVKDATGVSAAWLSGTATSADAKQGLQFFSGKWGSDAFVAVQPLPGSGTFVPEDSAGSTALRTTGRNVEATINGAYAVGSGLRISLNTTYLSLDVDLDSTLGAGSTSFTITGGGALFQLGPHVSINEQRSFAVQSVAASRLGNSDSGFLSQIVTGGQYSLVADEAARSAVITDEAISQVARLRGRMGAFEKNTLQTNIRSLEIAMENVTASESIIRDADFAAETAALTRGQILTSAATSVLAIANSTPHSVLQLLQ